MTREEVIYPCDTCKHDPEPWDSEACDGCCEAHSGYEPKDLSTESSTDTSDSSTETVSITAFEQVKWERDAALEQLEELGYGFAENIRTDEDCISRQAVLDLAKKGVLVSNGNYKAVCKAINELPSVTPKDDCISRSEAIRIASGYCHWSRIPEELAKLPSVKPKDDVEVLIKKIETELSWSMYDDWGNTTSLHDGLVDIIREWAERSGE